MENKIILIEDDEEIRGMITDYLSGEFEVLSFNDGTTAIRTNISYDEYSLYDYVFLSFEPSKIDCQQIDYHYGLYSNFSGDWICLL